MPSLKFLIGTSQSFIAQACSSYAHLWKTVNCLNLTPQARTEFFTEVVNRTITSVAAPEHFWASYGKKTNNEPRISVLSLKKINQLNHVLILRLIFCFLEQVIRFFKYRTLPSIRTILHFKRNAAIFKANSCFSFKRKTNLESSSNTCPHQPPSILLLLPNRHF